MALRLACSAITTLLMAFSLSCARAQLPTQTKLYRYQAVNRDLTEVLRGFAADQRLNLVLAPGIEGRPVSEEVEMHPTEFLNHITGKYGLVWYYDGTSLYIYRSDQLQTRAFPLRYTAPSRVVEVLKSIHAYTDRYAFRVLEDENVILAIAPPRMLEMVNFVIRTLESKENAAASSQVSIAVFPLRHASAADQIFDFEDSSMTIPGVASILQSVVTGQAIPGPMSSYLPRDRARLKGRGLDRFNSEQRRLTPEMLPPPLYELRQAVPGTATQSPMETQPSAEPEDNVQTPQPDVSTAQSNSIAYQPTISADPRLNAVVIRDHPDRMQSYERVIETLDHPTGLVEITAKIIDVSRESAFEWGLPLNSQWGDTGLTKQFSVQLTSTDATNFAVTLLRDQAQSFAHSIKALEQEGHARVTSRPSLLTMDNVQAQINNTETFFVKIEGSFEVDLFDVSAGTTLNVIPHIIEEEEGRVIRLTVQVDNGTVLQQTVNEIPRVRNDSLTTQAILRENESLLIGGMIREETSVSESRLPVLGRLPVVGCFFRTEEKITDSVERLILIEPKIVAYTAEGKQHWLQPNTPLAESYAIPAESRKPNCTSYPSDGSSALPLNPPNDSGKTPRPSNGKWHRILGPLRRLPKTLSPSTSFRHQASVALPHRSSTDRPVAADAVPAPSYGPVTFSIRSGEANSDPTLSVGGRAIIARNAQDPPTSTVGGAIRPREYDDYWAGSSTEALWSSEVDKRTLKERPGRPGQ